MSERARNLAHQLEQANQALIATIEGLSDAQWKATTPGTAGVSGSWRITWRRATRRSPASSGDRARPEGADDHHGDDPRGQRGARQQFANATKAETLALLRQNAAAAVASVRGLGDTELERTVTFPMGTMTAAQVVERVLIGHANDHHGTIRKALA
jgi:hypothetical protein